ncbi:MAG: CGLD27 family protein [Moorea sp. SIO2B7]|nr:CGLD27 family protein [Moorena sp. SIO2B7]
MKESSISICPVPIEQQPINEYEQLKDSRFFRLSTLDQLGYCRKLAWIWFWGWILAGPIAAASFNPQKYPVRFFLSGTFGAGFLVVFVLVRLYLGWSYVSDRLKKDKVSYEESGWYDGQIWQKPPSVVNRDRLIVSYQIEPILVRLKQTGFILAGIVAIGSLIWLFLP